MAVLIGVVLTGLLWVQSPTLMQTLAEMRRSVSEMDWMILNARIANMEDIAKFKLPFEPPRYTYDSAHGRIIAIVPVNRTWFTSTTVSRAKETLDEGGGAFCFNLFQPSDYTKDLNFEDKCKNFYAEFGWAEDEGKDFRTAHFNVVATYQNGHVLIK